MAFSILAHYEQVFLFQGDHNWTMKNLEILADMRSSEETMMVFSNSLDPIEIHAA